MTELFEAIYGSMVGRVAIAVLIVVAVLALLIALTALVTGLRRAAIFWLLAVVALLVGVAFLPVDTDAIVSRPEPAADFDTALARFEAMTADPAHPLNPLCEPQLLHHGAPTARVVVLMHGVSSCPRAFVDFAPILYERGDNVLVVRMPENGYADRSTDALKDMTADALAEFADTSVDIAAGLGEEVVVLGISAGGTAAGFAAQTRPEVDRAMLLAPFYGLAGMGTTINDVLMRVMLLAPSVSIWKDPIARENFEGMAHAYQRQETRGIGEIMRLGLATRRLAGREAPAAGEIVVVTNDADGAVSNAMTDEMAALWLAQGANVVTYKFPADYGLGHELIDPEEPGSDPELTYPVIFDLMDGKTPSGG